MNFILVLMAVTAATLPQAEAADNNSPFLGTWKYSPSKSRIKSGTVSNSSGSTVTIERDGDGLRWTNEGKQTKLSYHFQPDGKEYPVTGNESYTISVRQIDPYKWETTRKRRGEVVSTSQRSVSKDGQTLTVVWKRSGHAGERVVRRQVYERQFPSVC